MMRIRFWIYGTFSACLLLLANSAVSGSGDTQEPTEAASSQQAEPLFLTRRPPLGPAWIVDLADTSSAERLYLRTLQGIVNRSEARLYLVNSDMPSFGEGEQFWIDEYVRRGWVELRGNLTPDQATEKFRPEVAGFVVATESEPWSIHAAAVIAALQNGVVAPDSIADRLRNAGLRELDDMRGKWIDASSAFESIVGKYRDELAYPGLALLRPTENLWDFVIQQEIMPVFSRPKHATWEGVAAIMDTYPAGQVLYGYVSDDTVEEEIAVERASSSGKYLVPTSEVSNLSFHVAVMGGAPLLSVASRPVQQSTHCDSSRVNVAVAITDGDNLQVPIMQYPQESFWNSEKRGELPLGWSMGVSLATVAPGIWEIYRSTASQNDEIVSLMGIAYVHASSLPVPEAYYSDTFSAMSDLGLHTLWSLDSSLTITDEPLWEVLEKAPGSEVLHGVVVGYGPSIDKAFRRDTGTPVLITQNGYSEDAARIRQRIEAMMELDPAQRSPVNFLMATNWSTSAGELIDTLEPLVDQGVRFLTPAQALACMPDIEGIARSAVEKEAGPGSCLPTGRLQQYGSPILSAPTLAQINQPITLPLQLSLEPVDGSSKGYSVDLNVDPGGFARDFLQNRILPVVEGYGLSEEFAEYAWTRLEASRIQVRLPLPDNASGARISDLDVGDAGTTAVVVDNSIVISLGGFTADSRFDTHPVAVSFLLDIDHAAGSSPARLESGRDSTLLDFALTVGIGDEEGPLVGGVGGSMACRGLRAVNKR